MDQRVDAIVIYILVSCKDRYPPFSAKHAATMLSGLTALGILILNGENFGLYRIFYCRNSDGQCRSEPRSIVMWTDIE